MAVKNSVLGLQKALKVRTAGGDVTVNPAEDPNGYGGLLGQHYDARMAEQRQVEDATPLPADVDPAQAAYFKTVNRGAQDAAMGPAGYNRQWAGFLEAPEVLAENNPGATYRIDPTGLGNPAAQLAGISGKKKRPLPQTDAEFLAGNPGLKKRLGEL